MLRAYPFARGADNLISAFAGNVQPLPYPFGIAECYLLPSSTHTDCSSDPDELSPTLEFSSRANWKTNAPGLVNRCVVLFNNGVISARYRPIRANRSLRPHTFWMPSTRGGSQRADYRLPCETESVDVGNCFHCSLPPDAGRDTRVTRNRTECIARCLWPVQASVVVGCRVQCYKREVSVTSSQRPCVTSCARCFDDVSPSSFLSRPRDSGWLQVNKYLITA